MFSLPRIDLPGPARYEEAAVGAMNGGLIGAAMRRRCMSRDNSFENLLNNVDRIGATLGWSGWQIRGAQAAATLLISKVGPSAVEPNPSKADLNALARQVAEAMVQHQLSVRQPLAQAADLAAGA